MMDVETIWLSRQPVEIRPEPDSTMTRAVQQFDKSKPTVADSSVNNRVECVKALVTASIRVRNRHVAP
jgi:hypothetical protein